MSFLSTDADSGFRSFSVPVFSNKVCKKRMTVFLMRFTIVSTVEAYINHFELATSKPIARSTVRSDFVCKLQRLKCFWR